MNAIKLNPPEIYLLPATVPTRKPEKPKTILQIRDLVVKEPTRTQARWLLRWYKRQPKPDDRVICLPPKIGQPIAVNGFAQQCTVTKILEKDGRHWMQVQSEYGILTRPLLEVV